MNNTPENVSILSIESIETSNFINMKRMMYEQKGETKFWDVAQSHDSVAVLIYNSDKDSYVFVKQFRPPVFMCDTDGMTYELCAGIVDKDKTLIEIAQEEIDEECGYECPIENIHEISSFHSSVGTNGAKQTVFFALVDDSMKKHVGGGIETEDIEVLYVSRTEALELIKDSSKPKALGLAFGVTWFELNYLTMIKEEND